MTGFLETPYSHEEWPEVQTGVSGISERICLDCGDVFWGYNGRVQCWGCARKATQFHDMNHRAPFTTGALLKILDCQHRALRETIRIARCVRHGKPWTIPEATMRGSIRG